VKVTEYFERAKDDTFVSFEVLPPLKGGSMQKIFNTLDPLMEFKPPFIDVTYHREEYVYNRQDSGFYEKASIRKRPGTVGICAAIMHKYGVDAVPHLICGGFTKAETENALIDLNFLNVQFIPEKDGHNYALDLVEQVQSMNEGIYMDKNISDGASTDFCIGIAGYPEKHFESPNFESDLHFTKKKIEAGADYIVTQMFFDNQKYFEYVKKCRAQGINVPIVPGIKPLTKRYQLNSIPRMFFLNMPEDLVKAVVKADTPEKVREVGVEWAIAQCKELKAFGVPCLHFYTMGDWKTTKRIIEAVM